MADANLISVEFEVFGRVQGVFFRKYTQQEGTRLGVKGWCRNTRHGTVEGVIEGPATQVNQMKHWLKTQGSPHSEIDRADFRNEKSIAAFTFYTFGIKK